VVIYVLCFQNADFADEKRATAEGSDAKLKELNINTYKMHTLGDYPDTVLFFGTTDSYSTVGVSMQNLTVMCFEQSNTPNSQR